MRTTGWPAFSSASTAASCALFGFGLQTEVGEDAIVAVDVGLAERFAVDGNDALADLAGGFGEKLFEPRAEIVNPGRSDDA